MLDSKTLTKLKEADTGDEGSDGSSGAKAKSKPKSKEAVARTAKDTGLLDKQLENFGP